MRLDRRLWKRILITLGLLALARAGSHIPIPLPGLGERLSEVSRLAGWGPHGGLFIFDRFSVFALGVGPLLKATALLVLLGGLFPGLRRLRDGGSDETLRFDRLVHGLTVLICLLDAAFRWPMIRELLAPGAAAGWPGFWSRFIAAACQLAGTLFLVWLSGVITRQGIGNGLALLYGLQLATAWFGRLYAARRGLPPLFADGVPDLRALVAPLAFVLFCTGCVALLHAGRKLALVPRDAGSAGGPGEGVVAVPIRLNTVGATPIWFVLSVMELPSLVGFRLLPDPLTWPLPHLFFIAVQVFFLTFLLTAWGFSQRDFAATISRFGYRLAGSEGGAEAPAGRALEGATLSGAVALAAVAVLPRALWWIPGSGHLLFGVCQPELLVFVAIAFDTIRQGRAWNRMYLLVPEVAAGPSEVAAGPPEVATGPAEVEAGAARSAAEDGAGPVSEEVAAAEIGPAIERAALDDGPAAEGAAPDSWVEIYSADTALEARLVRNILARNGITAVDFSNRFFSALGTLAPWEWCRPQFPSLFVYRRLGGGGSSVFVLGCDEEKAARLIEAIPAA